MRLWRWIVSKLAGPDPDPVERALHERAEDHLRAAERSAVSLAATVQTLELEPEPEALEANGVGGSG